MKPSKMNIQPIKLMVYHTRDIPNDLFSQAYDLILERSPVDHIGLKARLRGAELIALGVDDFKVVVTATLKNPLNSYKERVFRSAGVCDENVRYKREIGYIATNSSREGQKLCQHLLIHFFSKIENQNIFATTRDAAMMHILQKIGFVMLGKAFKDNLILMVLNKAK